MLGEALLRSSLGICDKITAIVYLVDLGFLIFSSALFVRMLSSPSVKQVSLQELLPVLYVFDTLLGVVF